MKDNLRLEVANSLYEAKQNKMPIRPVSETFPELNAVDAYEIQLLNIERELQQGHIISGKKIGLTSKVMQEMFDVSEPDYGHIFQHLLVVNEVDTKLFLSPRVEAEVAFVLKEDIIGPNVTEEEVISKTDYVLASIEIVDSRIEDWQIRLIDTVADNASFGAYTLGSIRLDPKETDLRELQMEFYQNGKLINTGCGRDVLGDPATCVAWLANKMSEFDISLKKGEVILSGAFSSALDAKKGDLFEARFTKLGNVSVLFK